MGEIIYVGNWSMFFKILFTAALLCVPFPLIDRCMHYSDYKNIS